MTLPELRPAWPSYRSLLTMRGTRWSNLGRQLQLGGTMLRTLSLRRHFESRLCQASAGGALLRRDGRFFEPLYYNYVNTSLSRASCFRLAAQDLSRLTRHVSLHGEADVCVYAAPEWSLVFGINTVCREEGYWALTLRNAAQESIYCVALACTEEGDLLVGSVQGCELAVADPKEAIRVMTKAMEGMRPPYFLVEALKAMCRKAGTRLKGVSASCQVKAHRRSKAAAKVFFDYDAFWAECGGISESGGYWEIPTAQVTRDLEAVPSKKRAMYRRREALIADVVNAIDAMSARLPPYPDDAPGSELGQVNLTRAVAL